MPHSLAAGAIPQDMLTALDYVVITVYFVGIALLGVRIAGRQRTTVDYFLGGRNLPWWVVCFSVVATETSTLTIIGLPAVAYGGTLTFMQLTLGYLLGRTLVAIYLLPRYYDRELQTTYEFLGLRYGGAMAATASVTFIVTRLLADGVRLFASAIPLKVIADSAGLSLGYFEIIFILAAVTVFYTWIGGIRAVVWIDVVQLCVYLLAGVLASWVLLSEVPADWWSIAASRGKTTIVDPGTHLSISDWLTNAYVLPSAVLGGAVFSLASHGTDQLMVQRLLACRSLRDGQKALVGSALLVMLQFAMFLTVGLLLWSYYGGASLAEIGVSRGDEIFPRFIVDGLPPGISGLLLAGIIAASMSTLSSSVNSLASSSTMDLYLRFRTAAIDDRQALVFSRRITLFWGVALAGFASLFTSTDNPVVELGLTIASFTYGGLLGIFLLAILVPGSRQADALAAFCVTVVTMICIITAVRFSPNEGWVFAFLVSEADAARRGLVAIAWPWYPVIGSSITVAVGSATAGLRTIRRRPAAETG